MEKFKNILRWIRLILLVLLALSGVAMGAMIAPRRERDFDNEIKIELVDEELEESQFTELNEKKQE